MIEWFTWLQVAVAVAGGVFCVVRGLIGRAPNDLTLATAAFIELLLIAQVVVALIAPATGNQPTGSLLEFWVYLISAALLPPLAAFWALIDRNRWSTVVIGIACFAVAVMLYRMLQIWFVQVA